MAISRTKIPKEIKRSKGGKVTDKNWIQKAIKRPGALRKKAGVKEGEKIPASKLRRLSKSKNPRTIKQVQLMKTLGKMNRKKG